MRMIKSATANIASWRSQRGTTPECCASPKHDDAVVAHVAADARDDGQRQLARDHHRTLFDMQFEIGLHTDLSMRACWVRIASTSAPHARMHRPSFAGRALLEARSAALILPNSAPEPM